VLESTAPGGQAGSSSKIENYLGFPTGISGQALTGRAYTQAQKFGAQVAIARHARRLTCDRKGCAIEIDGGVRVPARTVIIATALSTGNLRSRTWLGSKAPACITARRSWKHSCARVKS
jgi:thioredoxin reductase (NADPH)